MTAPHGVTDPVAVLLRAGTILRRNIWLAAVAVVTVGIGQVAWVAGQYGLYSALPEGPSYYVWSVLPMVAYGVNAIGISISIVTFVIMAGLVAPVVSDGPAERRSTVRTWWPVVAPRLPGLIAVGLLSGLAIGGVVVLGGLPVLLDEWAADDGFLPPFGRLPTALLVVCLWGGVVLAAGAAAWLAVAGPAQVIDRLGPVSALRRSMRVLRPVFLPAAAALALAAMLTFAVNLGIGGLLVLVRGEVPFSVGGPPTLRSHVLAAVGTVVTSAVTAPFSACVAAVLHHGAAARSAAVS